ncbi:hypothetical protein ON010_g4765 [Phytophthora cinnamomi]|nr:hypothetical protein ON010_g4765 [Phytophthora cinnamomi]
MGNVCACCKWGRSGSDSKGAKAKKNDAWFEQDSVPLVSAKHGPDDDDGADGSLKRTVLIRSPRTTRASTSDIEERPSHQRTTRYIQQQHEDEERQYHVHRVKSASVDSSRYSRRSRRSEHADDEERPRSRSRDRHRHSLQEEDSQDRYRHERRTARSSSLEVQDSARELRSLSSASAHPHRTASHSQDAASFADDEVESVGSYHGSTRSHRSSSASSSPKASSRSGSPKKKQRYGRKHYRANANRK